MAKTEREKVMAKKKSKLPVGRPPKIKPLPEYSTGKGSNTEVFRKLCSKPEPEQPNKFDLSRISCSPKTEKTIVPPISSNNLKPGQNSSFDARTMKANNVNKS